MATVSAAADATLRQPPGPGGAPTTGRADPGVVHAAGRPLPSGVPRGSRGHPDARGLSDTGPRHRDHAQPVRRHGVDAAIFFSDIVVPLAAVGVDIDIVPGTGPVVAKPVRPGPTWTGCRLTPDQVPDIAESVRRITEALGATPLVGFAGAPFTLASYLVEGGPAATTSTPRP